MDKRSIKPGDDITYIGDRYLSSFLPSVLWRCWLGGRKGIRPVKTERWGADVVICLEQGADLHMAQLMPLPLTVSFSSKIQIGFTFLVPAHPGSPGKRAVKRVCVWFSKFILYCVFQLHFYCNLCLTYNLASETGFCTQFQMRYYSAKRNTLSWTRALMHCCCQKPLHFLRQSDAN